MKKYILVALLFLLSFSLFSSLALASDELSKLIEQESRVEALRERVVTLIGLLENKDKDNMVVFLEEFLLSAENILQKIEEAKALLIEGSEITCPKMAWLEMRKEVDNIVTFADFEMHVLKYGSKDSVKDFMDNKNEIDALPDFFKDYLVQSAKGPLLSEITDIKEEVDDDGNVAYLNVQTTDSRQTGVINLLFEDNKWKVDSEEWKIVI